jgi:hypothetical protein
MQLFCKFVSFFCQSLVNMTSTIHLNYYYLKLLLIELQSIHFEPYL